MNISNVSDCFKVHHSSPLERAHNGLSTCKNDNVKKVQLYAVNLQTKQDYKSGKHTEQ